MSIWLSVTIIVVSLLSITAFHYFKEYSKNKSIKKLISNFFGSELLPQDETNNTVRSHLHENLRLSSSLEIKPLKLLYRINNKAYKEGHFFSGYWNMNPDNFGFGVKIRLEKELEALSNPIEITRRWLFVKKQKNVDLDLSDDFKDRYLINLDDSAIKKSFYESLVSLVKDNQVDHIEINNNVLFLFSIYGKDYQEGSCKELISNLINTSDSVFSEIENYSN